MAVIDGMFPRWFINKKTMRDKIFRNIKELDEAGSDWITKDEFYGIPKSDVVIKREEIEKPEPEKEIVPIKIVKSPPTVEVQIGHPKRAQMKVRPREDKNEKIKKDDPETMEFLK